MSVLTTAVSARFRTQLLVQLTNQNDPTATSANSTVLGAAATDAAADFLTYTGTTYDETNAQHVRIAVLGVIAVLFQWAGQEGMDSRLKAFRTACDEYARTNARARVTPLSDKELGPTPFTDGAGNALRPTFDRTRNRGFDVGSPPARGDAAEDEDG